MQGIDQKALAAYEKGGQNLTEEELAYVKSNAPTQERIAAIAASSFVPPSTQAKFTPSVVTQTQIGTKQSSPNEYNADQSSERITNFNVALNKAIDEARQQRKDSVLDLHGGMIPAGALPASSFAQVLSAFNNSSAPIEASLLSSATAFAEDQEKMKAAAEETKRIQMEDNKNQIYQLALSVATETGDTKAAEMIRALAESGDIDTAIKLSLPAYGAEYAVGADGKSIIKKGKDGDDTSVWSYNAGTQQNDNPQPGEDRVGMFVGREDSWAEIPNIDYTKGTEAEAEGAIAKYISPSFATKVAKSFPASHTKAFINGYIELTNATGQYQDPEQYLQEYAMMYNLQVKDVEEAKKKEAEEDKEVNIYTATGLKEQ